MSHGPSSPIVMESVRPDTILHTITPLAVTKPLIDAIKALIYHKLGQNRLKTLGKSLILTCLLVKYQLFSSMVGLVRANSQQSSTRCQTDVTRFLYSLRGPLTTLRIVLSSTNTSHHGSERVSVINEHAATLNVAQIAL